MIPRPMNPTDDDDDDDIFNARTAVGMVDIVDSACLRSMEYNGLFRLMIIQQKQISQSKIEKEIYSTTEQSMSEKKNQGENGLFHIHIVQS